MTLGTRVRHEDVPIQITFLCYAIFYYLMGGSWNVLASDFIVHHLISGTEGVARTTLLTLEFTSCCPVRALFGRASCWTLRKKAALASVPTCNTPIDTTFASFHVNVSASWIADDWCTSVHPSQYN